MPSPTLFLHLLTAGSWFACGTVWTMQLINYPLLRHVGPDSFVRFEQAHNRRFGLVVFPPLAVVVAALIALWVGPVRHSGAPLLTVASGLLASILVITATMAAPAHAALSRGFDEATFRRLTLGSWLRTAAWSLLAFSATALLATQVSAGAAG